MKDEGKKIKKQILGLIVKATQIKIMNGSYFFALYSIFFLER